MYSQGASINEARTNIQEAINLFLVTCFEMGTLDEVLKSCGFMPSSTNAKDVATTEDETVEIVLPFIAAQKQQECLA